MSQGLLKEVTQCPSLPTLPTVAIEVLELTSDPSIGVRRIAKAVENDQALAAKILKVVNSSFYGLSKPCPSIPRAVSYLGLNTVKSLVLSFSMLDTFRGKGDEPAPITSMWQRGVYSAAGARAIAQKLPGVDADEAFIGGLLQDVGMLAMVVALREEYIRILMRCGDDHPGQCGLEQQEFGLDHAQVGRRLGEIWKLPECIRSLIGSHHDRASDDDAMLLRCVRLATVASRVLCVPGCKRAPAEFVRTARRTLDMDAEAAQKLLEEIATGARALARLFHVPTAATRATLLTEASDQLVEHQLSVEREREQMVQANEQLSRRAITDALTGAHNRAHFDESLTWEFEYATLHKAPLALIIADADHFKGVNDTHGHTVGDAVLVELARRLREAVGDSGKAFRYGGEEFAVLLPRMARAEAGRTAERIRVAVEETPFTVAVGGADPLSLPVSLSLGVAALDPSAGHVFADASQLVVAADRGVYAAKSSGRNCVRIYSPRVGVEDRRKAPASSARAADGERRGPRAPSGLAGSHVLLVEDEALHARLVEMVAAEIEGLRMSVTATAEEALDLLTRPGCDVSLVITDMKLPGMSGLEFIEKARQLRNKELRIIVITALESPQAMAKALGAGANAFVSKAQIAENPRDLIHQLLELWCARPAA